MSERAVLSLHALVEGEREAMASFARQLVDGAGVFADENGVTVEIQDSRLTKPADEDVDLDCAICEESLKGKNVTTIEGGRLVCMGCAAKQEAGAS